MLGCVLYTLMFNRHPFPDTSSQLAIANGRYIIDEVEVGARVLPKLLCQLCHWLLALRPSDRPTASKIIDLLAGGATDLTDVLPEAVLCKLKQNGSKPTREANKPLAAKKSPVVPWPSLVTVEPASQVDSGWTAEFPAPAASQVDSGWTAEFPAPAAPQDDSGWTAEFHAPAAPQIDDRYTNLCPAPTVLSSPKPRPIKADQWSPVFDEPYKGQSEPAAEWNAKFD